MTPLPTNPGEVFGREEEIQAIDQHFQENGVLLLLNGIGGIGKTTVAREYLRRCRDFYDVVGWINFAQSIETSVIEAFIDQKDFQFTGEPNEIYKQILRKLTHLPGKKLLVFDNLNDQKESKKLNRDFGDFRVLLTSRSELGFRKIPIVKLEFKEAAKLFRNHCQLTIEDSMLQALFDQIGYHTLMIEMLAKTLVRNLVPSAQKLLTALKNSQYDNSALKVKVPIEHSEEDKPALQHLSTLFDLAKLDNYQIWILKHFSLLPSTIITGQQLLDFFQIQEEEQEKFNESVQSLWQTGWLQQTEEGFICHQVIQYFIFLKAPPKPDEYENMVHFFADQLSWKPTENNLNKAKWLPWSRSIAERSGCFETGTLTSLFSCMALIYLDLGRLREALKFAGIAITICEKILEPDHPSLAASYNNKAMIYQDLGRLQKALEFAGKATAIREKILEPDHPDLATSYSNMATIYQDLGKLQEALEFASKDIKICEKILKPDHPSLATSYNNMATIYKNQGRLQEALEFTDKATTICEKILEPDHPSLATSYNNMASVYCALGRFQEALEFAKKTTKIHKKILGPDHPSLATSYNNMAIIYQNLGRMREAEEQLLKAIGILEQVFPEGHPNLDIFRGNLERLQAEK